jgi:hypothetical protein
MPSISKAKLAKLEEATATVAWGFVVWNVAAWRAP